MCSPALSQHLLRVRQDTAGQPLPGGVTRAAGGRLLPLSGVWWWCPARPGVCRSQAREAPAPQAPGTRAPVCRRGGRARRAQQSRVYLEGLLSPPFAQQSSVLQLLVSVLLEASLEPRAPVLHPPPICWSSSRPPPVAILAVLTRGVTWSPLLSPGSMSLRLLRPASCGTWLLLPECSEQSNGNRRSLRECAARSSPFF